jgi:hypothetical protein
MSWSLRAAQTVFYSLVHYLIAQYIYIYDDKVASEWVEFNVYVDEKNNKEYLFLVQLPGKLVYLIKRCETGSSPAS